MYIDGSQNQINSSNKYLFFEKKCQHITKITNLLIICYLLKMHYTNYGWQSQILIENFYHAGGGGIMSDQSVAWSPKILRSSPLPNPLDPPTEREKWVFMHDVKDIF